MTKTLLKSQKKQIFDLLIQTGLDPMDFEWDEISMGHDSAPISLFRHKGTKYFFKFDFIDHAYNCAYMPGQNRPFGKHNSTAWEDIFEHIRTWLIILKKETITVDPWEEIEKYIPDRELNIQNQKTNTLFAMIEIKHINRSLTKLEYRINETYALEASQQARLKNKLEYLRERLKSFGRMDWKNVFVGIIINIIFDMAMDSKQANTLWQLVKECFKGTFLLEN